MHRILTIGHTDLRVFFKNKSSYVWLFLMPLSFVYIMGLATPAPKLNQSPAITITVDNRDIGFLGKVFIDELKSQNAKVVDGTTASRTAGLVRIPADFTAKVIGRESGKVEFVRADRVLTGNDALVEARVGRAMITINGHILQASTVTGNAAGLTEENIRQAMAAPDPVILKTGFAGTQPRPSGFGFSLPGNLVMYLLMNLLVFGGSSLAGERRRGVLKRMVVHPVTSTDIVVGKIYGLMLLGGLQILFFLIFGTYVLHVNLGPNLGAITLLLIVFAWVAASLGILLGSLTIYEDRVTGLCVLTSLTLAALGGCWWPLEIGPPILKTIALTLPTGWALEGLHSVISFGKGLDSLSVPLCVLLAFGTVANMLAFRFFKV